MVLEYSWFLEYIVAQGLEDVCELKPIVNGREIMEALGAQEGGSWISTALSLVFELQLLHPDMDKEKVLDEIRKRREELGL